MVLAGWVSCCLTLGFAVSCSAGWVNCSLTLGLVSMALAGWMNCRSILGLVVSCSNFPSTMLPSRVSSILRILLAPAVASLGMLVCLKFNLWLYESRSSSF
uniref:NADH dehydrogenase subunit 6 n=1 Tax=Cacopsylla melanoneura TaxID=428564 RepID=A0A8D8QYA4_9HEMI